MLPVQRELPRLSPSRSKTDFLQHLGLDDQDPTTNELYLEMMNEAAEGWLKIVDDRNNLTREARNSNPPFSSNQIRESAIHTEVLNVYHSASVRTKLIYKAGLHPYGSRGVEQDNWIIRWCLWHVFRYRDERNRTYRQKHPELNKKRGSNYPMPGIMMNVLPQEPESYDTSPVEGSALIKTESFESSHGSSGSFDSGSSPGSPVFAQNTHEYTPKRSYDPVRDVWDS